MAASDPVRSVRADLSMLFSAQHFADFIVRHLTLSRKLV